jgi:uncharacterized protein YdeI (YjbR/CyaY-like superfamily)
MGSELQELKGLPIMRFERQEDWAIWLDENHATSPGVWVKLAKKTSKKQSVSYDEAVEVALCYGWIDGQSSGQDESFWLQKFTPRRSKSVWSKINRERAERLIENGQMRPAGLAAVESAKQDGRWDAAYDSPSTASVPADFQAALDRNSTAQAFYATLNSTNRYAILHRIQTARKPETRAKRIQQFIQMLENQERLYS